MAQWLAGDAATPKDTVAELVAAAGYVPVDLAGIDNCAAVLEAPRRPGAVYGEEYREPEARHVVEAVQAGRPIPPTPQY